MVNIGNNINERERERQRESESVCVFVCVVNTVYKMYIKGAYAKICEKNIHKF